VPEIRRFQTKTLVYGYGVLESQRVNTLTSKGFMQSGEVRMKDERAEPSNMGKGGFPDE
jgi:hypothetical protein